LRVMNRGNSKMTTTRAKRGRHSTKSKSETRSKREKEQEKNEARGWGSQKKVTSYVNTKENRKKGKI